MKVTIQTSPEDHDSEIDCCPSTRHVVLDLRINASIAWKKKRENMRNSLIP